MSTTYRELIYAAVTNATRGQPAQVSPAVDAEGIAETLFPIASQAVSEAAAADPYKRSLPRRQKTVTLVAGQATIPDDVLTKYFPDAVLLDPAILTLHYAYRDYPDFVRRNDPRLGYFTRNGTTLLVRDPNQGFTQPLIATGQRLLTVPCVILRPATADSAVDAPDELVSDLVETLGESLRGELIKRAGENA